MQDISSNQCRFCKNQDATRKNGNKIRCRKYSKWVELSENCEEYAAKLFQLTPEAMMQHIESMQHYQKKHGVERI